MEYILGEARFYFAQCVFTSKCHYVAYDRYSRQRNKRQWIAGCFSGFTAVLLELTIIGWDWECDTLLQVVSFLSLTLTAASLVFEIMCRQDLTELMMCHKHAAQDYMSLRDKFMDAIRRIMQGDNKDEVSCELKLFLHDYDLLGEYALPTSSSDYVDAQKKLGLYGEDEAFTWSDEEIDAFLPEALRITHLSKTTPK